MRVLGVLLLLAAAARAQAPVDGGAIDLLPGLEYRQRAAAKRALGAFAQKYRKLDTRLSGIDKRLRQRPPAAEAKKLREEAAALRRARARLPGELNAALLAAGLRPDDVERLRRMPRGPLREPRYNRSALFEVTGLTLRQEEVLRHLVAATDAAQLALEAQQRVLQREENQELRRRLVSAVQQRIRAIERRFWRIAYYVLDGPQMREARTLFSPRYASIPQLREQMLALPGMTPSQGTRVLALFAEQESENAADSAAVNRLRTRQREPGLAAGERKAIQRRIGAAYGRMGQRNNAFRDRLRTLLTPDQLDALRAAPPQLSGNDRNRPPFEIAAALALLPGQAKAVAELKAGVDRFRNAQRQAYRREAGPMMGVVGPESPQMMTMQMMGQNTNGKIMRRYRAAGQRMVLDVLEPGQLAAWICTP